MGSICSNGAATQCAADTFNPFLGKSASGACQACSHTAGNAFTSDAGSDYCTIPWFNTNCADGQTWDDSANACVACPTGTKRGSSDSTCVSW